MWYAISFDFGNVSMKQRVGKLVDHGLDRLPPRYLLDGTEVNRPAGRSLSLGTQQRQDEGR